MRGKTLAHQFDIISEHHLQALPVKISALSLKLGIKVYQTNQWPDHISGMIKRNKTNDDKFVIFVNASHHKHRRRFTVAHELAHFILHRSLIGNGITDNALYRSNLSNHVESQANRLAADLLMPWSLLNPLLDDGVTDIEVLARRFLVSPSAMGIRLGTPYEMG